MKNSIDKIQIEVENNPNFKDRLPDVTQISEKSLPTKFYYNGSWKITHKCTDCQALISLGVETDGINNWVYSYKQTKPICSKNYTEEKIKELNKDIEESRIFTNDKGVFLGLPEEFDPNFAISSSLRLNYYNCTNCQKQHIMLGYIIFGDMPEKANVVGQNNQFNVVRIFSLDTSLEL